MRIQLYALVCIFFMFSTMTVQAHPLGEVVQETTIMNEDGRLLILYNTSIGPSITTTLIPDAGHDGKVSVVEESQLARAIHKILSPNLEILLDDKNVVPELYYDSVAPAPGGYNNGLRSNLIYSIPISSEDYSKHYFKFSDNNFKAGELKWLKWLVQADPQFSVVKTTPDSRELSYQFFARQGGVKTELKQITPDSPPENILKPQPQEDASQAALKDYLSRENLGTGAVLFALGLAFILGMGHALSPGHGKAMVAAYLIGRSGRVRDAFTLGIIVTITHVASVIVLGIAALMLSRYFLPGDLYPWLGAFSGILVFIVGYIMLAKRAVHRPSRSPSSRSPSYRKQRGCFMVVNAESWDSGRDGSLSNSSRCLACLCSIWANIFWIIVDSIIQFRACCRTDSYRHLTVRASKLTERFSGARNWIENLPVFSAGLVMLAGIAIALNALHAGGILKFM